MHARGLGLANLEFSAPITPATPFHVPSVSKQFTGFAVQLLAAEGKLSLDDEVRRWVPELHGRFRSQQRQSCHSPNPQRLAVRLSRRYLVD